MNLCYATFPNISFCFIFRSGRRLSSFFPFKDRIPTLLRSHVVYKYTCQCCSALYLGQTRRYLYARISEHMGIFPLTGKKLATSSLSTILANSHQTSLRVSFNDFSLTSSGHSSSNLEVLIQKSLLVS